MLSRFKIFLLSFLVLFITQFYTFFYARNQKVVIIGAGLAGLTAAHRLHQKNIDVEVYEARKRLGGRVFSGYAFSEKLGKRVIEFGAQNILDGDEAFNLRALIAEHGLELMGRMGYPKLCYLDEMQKFFAHELMQNEKRTYQEFSQKLGELKKTTQNMKEVLDSFYEAHEPLYGVLSSFLNSYEGGKIEDLSSMYISTLQRLMIFLKGIAPFKQISQGEKFDENASYWRVSVKGGNGLLTQKLADNLGERVHLQMPLTTVTKTSHGSYLLTFKNGETVAADLLILAIPCTVYKDINFASDVIDEKKLSQIKNIHYGTHGKIMIPLHEDPPMSAYFMSDCTCVDVIDGVVTFYSRNEAGCFSAETLAATYQQDRYVAVAAVGQDALSQKEPVYARDQFLAVYDGPVGYSWKNELYSQGSYSYIAAGQEKVLTALHEVDGEQVRALFAPVNENTFYFAGEHTTTNFGIIGTMEAACESGERAARMIQKNIQKK